jgi:hypothetical protein
MIATECLPTRNILKTMRLNKTKPRYIYPSELYMSFSERFYIPQSKEYSGYEKLLFPFDRYTWNMIMFVFAAAFVTIFIVNRLTTNIRNLVFGENVEHPATNVMGHFFGLGQIVLPRKSFARFLVMMFIIYCLIIRTAWQSKIFEFMQKEIRKPEIKSYQEILDKKLDFYYQITALTSGSSRIPYQ